MKLPRKYLERFLLYCSADKVFGTILIALLFCKEQWSDAVSIIFLLRREGHLIPGMLHLLRSGAAGALLAADFTDFTDFVDFGQKKRKFLDLTGFWICLASPLGFIGRDLA